MISNYSDIIEIALAIAWAFGVVFGMALGAMLFGRDKSNQMRNQQ